MTTISMQISGMTCGHCVTAVRKALEAVPSATVEQLAIGSATVAYDESATTANGIAQAVEDEGYAVTLTP